MNRGGFNASGFAGSGKPTTAVQPSSASKPTAKGSQPSLRPVTIKSILEAQRIGDGVFVVDGKEVSQVTVVGRIVEHESATQAATAKFHGYKITDGTGWLMVKQWHDVADGTEPLPIDHFVRATGTVKLWQERPQMTGTVREITDNNEVTAHFLEAILIHLRITKGRAPSVHTGPTTSASGPGNTVPRTDSNIQAAISRMAMNPSNRDVGVSITDLLNALSGKDGVSQADVRAAVRSMIDQGSLFTTIDDSHYGC